MKISDREYAKILAERKRKKDENERLRKEMLEDEALVELVKENTKKALDTLDIYGKLL